MFEVDQKFPSDKDKVRIEIQTNWEKMYHSEYIYNKIIDFKGKQVPIDPIVPIPATLSEINADLLFGEMPLFNFQDEKQNELVQNLVRNKLERDLLELATYTSALGTVFWKFFKTDGNTNYEFIQANKAIWTEDINGLVDVMFFEEIVPENLKAIQIKKNRVYLIEEHFVENNQYTILRYKILVDKNTGKIKEVIFNEDEDVEKPEGVDFLPIVKVVNIGMMGSILGKSDYQGKEQLFAEIDNRVDQINFVLQENADPWKFVPPGILDPKGRFRRQDGKTIEKGASGTDNTVDIVTWDASLDAAFRQIEKMVKMVFFTSRISSPIAGLENDKSGGAVESGRALKWRSINTFSMINKKRRYYDNSLRQAFEILSKLDDDYKALPIDKLVIEWQDGLPQDSTEKVENVAKQIQNGILSHLKAIQQINEVDEDTAQKELDQIKKEQGDTADIAQRSLPITL